MNQYTIYEVAKHNKEDDCWIIAKNNVYDVSKFINIHPGSKNAILKHAGKICDIDFDFHSKNAKKLWKKYKIGILKKKRNYNNSFCIIC